MLTIVTTCKGRLDHLKDLIGCLQKQSDKDFKHITVDYGCPERTIDYINQLVPFDNRFSCIRVKKDGFNLSEARNIGADFISDGWIFFCDADTLFERNFLKEKKQQINESNSFGCYFTGEPTCSGNCIVHAKWFHFIGQYDQQFNGWGAEDADLYIRLTHKANLRKKFLTDMRYQHHSDQQRSRFYKEHWQESQRNNIKLLLKKYPKQWICPDYIAPELIFQFI